MKDRQRAGLVVLLSVICAFHVVDLIGVIDEMPGEMGIIAGLGLVLIITLIFTGIQLLAVD